VTILIKGDKMKIIEAMKRIKENKEKIADLQSKIFQYHVNMSYETPVYGPNTPGKIQEWLQSCHDLAMNNVKLLTQIAKTNLATSVTITLNEKPITKTIAEWVWRRREYAAIDLKTWAQLNDRNLKDMMTPATVQGAEPTKITVVRHYNPEQRDVHLNMYKSEPHQINAALEVINAVTDLVE
jgi:hypothetical protein